MATGPRPRFGRETHPAMTRRARQIHRLLAERFPEAHCELTFDSPFQLLIATVLSAQTTDKQVNLVTPALFARYPDPAHLAEADPLDVEAIIRPAGYYRQKTKSVCGIGRELMGRFGGEVPRTMEELVSLPGVGRKTANVVLGNAFAIPGFAVDTHVTRLSNRLGFVDTKDPVAIEAVVTALFPPEDWTIMSHLLIFQGRYVCHARRPECAACSIASLCPSAGDFG